MTSDSTGRDIASVVGETALPLLGKVALVTGATRGLGREMVLALAQAGADVVVVSRKQQACDELAHEVRRVTGRRALARACHVGHWVELDELVDDVYSDLGRLDVLVNNAGMSPLYPSLSAVTEDLFDKVLAVNLKGPFRLSALVGERMGDGGGVILNISSVAAVRPSPESLPYAAAKAGLNALTRGLAAALGPAVRVNAIMAGPFRTDVAATWTEAFEARVQGYPLGRIGAPSEIMGAAIFLVTDASSFVTGAVMPVDGGMSATPV
jgi:NAD(P)-dependent dehydrogenase (short-subunit alcohol dehydrogenase family)